MREGDSEGGHRVANRHSGWHATNMTLPGKREWRDFERIIAAIEIATNRGATVTWDEDIDGRQFDVAVRFTNGPHQYLTLIECKDPRNVSCPVNRRERGGSPKRAHSQNDRRAASGQRRNPTRSKAASPLDGHTLTLDSLPSSASGIEERGSGSRPSYQRALNPSVATWSRSYPPSSALVIGCHYSVFPNYPLGNKP